jgi:hypothetical protein
VDALSFMTPQGWRHVRASICTMYLRYNSLWNNIMYKRDPIDGTYK